MIPESADLPVDASTGLPPKLLAASEFRLAVPLFAAFASPIYPAQIQRFMSQYSFNHEGGSKHCGIMTLRNANDVIVAPFFFALRTEAAMARRLHVPRLRAAEPAGRHTTLGAALRTVAALGERLGCREAMLQAEESSAAWLETVAGLIHVGPAHGYEPRGPDWVRVLTGGERAC
jgi:hypothetical protein